MLRFPVFPLLDNFSDSCNQHQDECLRDFGVMLYDHSELMASEEDACDRFGRYGVHHVRFPVEE